MFAAETEASLTSNLNAYDYYLDLSLNQICPNHNL